jgi:hypothetical protein
VPLFPVGPAGLPAGDGVIVLFMAERYSILYLSPQKTEEKSFVKKFVMHPTSAPRRTPLTKIGLLLL